MQLFKPQRLDIDFSGVRHDEDAGVFVSFCPRLEVYSQGETHEEAVEAIKGAITLRLSTAFDHNRLDRILRKAGFQSIQQGQAILTEPEEFVHDVDVKMDKDYTEVPVEVPLTLLAAQSQFGYASSS